MNPFRHLDTAVLVECLQLNGKEYSIDFCDSDGNQTAFGVPDEFHDWLEEVQRRLRR